LDKELEIENQCFDRFLLLDGIALFSLLAFRSIPTQNLLYVCDYRPILDTYNKIRYEGETFPVKYVIPNADPWSVFEKNATNLIDPFNVQFNPLKGGYASRIGKCPGGSRFLIGRL
jgi:hypothetical protein